LLSLRYRAHLDLIGDVEVEGKIEEIADTGVVHGVKTLNNDNGSGLNGLGGVEGSVDVVVDGLLDSLALLKVLELLVHSVKVILLGVEGSELDGERSNESKVISYRTSEASPKKVRSRHFAPYALLTHLRNLGIEGGEVARVALV